jgi:hypothetical protein
MEDKNEPRRCAAGAKCLNAVDGAGKTFTPKRPWQQFCTAECGDHFNNSRRVRKAVATGPGSHAAGWDTHFRPPRPPDPIRRVLWEKDGGFSWQREPGARAALKIRQSGRIARIALAPEAI